MKKKNAGIQYFRAFACVAVFLSHLLGSLTNGVMLGNVDLNVSQRAKTDKTARHQNKSFTHKEKPDRMITRSGR